MARHLTGTIKNPKTIQDKCFNLLVMITLLEQRQSNFQYRYFGPYWEIVYRLCKQHHPEKLKEYEDTVGTQFFYTSEIVFRAVNSGDDHLNFERAVHYYTNHEPYGNPFERHELIINNETYYYIPNDCLLKDTIHGLLFIDEDLDMNAPDYKPYYIQPDFD